ncbi:MAG: hypothetical protein AAGJ40_09275 [Planctomycetota bacterium]
MTPEANRYQADMVLHAISAALGVPSIMPGEYRNPFDFLTEFDEWFEFKKRQYADREPTHRIIKDMLSHDLHRAALSYDSNLSALKAMADEHYGRMKVDTRSIGMVTSQ